MRWNRRILLGLAALLAAAMLVPEDAEARGGGGRRGGKGKRGKNGEVLDRRGVIDEAEDTMRNSDRDRRLLEGRKAHLDGTLAERRQEVLDRNRRRGEDSRRDRDSQREVSR